MNDSETANSTGPDATDAEATAKWAAVDRAFDRALDLEGQDRLHFLDSLADDVRSEVEQLLEAATSDGPLSGGVGQVAGRLLHAVDRDLDPDVTGRRIGS
ncbi:MAG: hypothetical protein AAGF23_12020, partial [Acidobacteriota bacterium]